MSRSAKWSVGDDSPWGVVVSVENIAHGITFVATAGHGGILLDQLRVLEFYHRFRGFRTFGDNPNYAFEEDCDWAAVALAFSEYFNASQVDAACELVESMSKWDGSGDKWKVFMRQLRREQDVRLDTWA